MLIYNQEMALRYYEGRMINMLEVMENGGIAMSADVFQQAKLNVYMKNLEKVARDKVNGNYNKDKYDIQVAMVGRSCGISTKTSRENLNTMVKAIRNFLKSNDEQYLDVEIKLK